jgi:hypothetical protein
LQDQAYILPGFLRSGEWCISQYQTGQYGPEKSISEI